MCLELQRVLGQTGLIYDYGAFFFFSFFFLAFQSISGFPVTTSSYGSCLALKR